MSLDPGHPAPSQATRVDASTSVPRHLAGLWGEALTVQALRAMGFAVEWEGGLQPGRDLIASRDGSLWHVQVKTTTDQDGKVVWQKPGDLALEWEQAAIAKGAAGAFFVLVQVNAPGCHEFDLERGVLTIDLPKDAALVAVTAADFAQDVNTARGAYGAQKRVRRGRRGEPIGSLLSPDGLRYPVHTGDYPFLADFVASTIIAQ